jgi:Ca-activated chloride channel family protein
MVTHALALTLGLDERGLLPAATTRLHLVAEVSAVAPGIERARPPLAVVLAVDVSGSMHGPPLEQVVQSIERLVGLLEPTDRVGVVAFSDSAAEVAPLAPANLDGRRLIAARARRLLAEGGTNVEAGLRKAAELMPPRGLHERQVILLLSDGIPNRGAATAAELAALARSLRPEIGVSTLGYGPSHHEDVLRAISEGGAGRFHFIADPAVCEVEFATALGAQGDVVAEAVEISIAPAPGVEIVRFLGNPETRIGAAGLKIAVPDLLEGSRHLVVAEIDVAAPPEAGPLRLLGAQLAYRRAGEREPRILDDAVTALVGGERGVDPAIRARVHRARADEVRAEARRLADRGQFEGAAAVIRRQIQAIQAEPWFVADDGSPLAETVEQLLDEAVALERKPSREAYTQFRLSQLGTQMSSMLPVGPTAGPTSMRSLAAVGGDLPRAILVVVTGEGAGRRIPLDRPRAVIGRTTAADILLRDANVSRQHANIVALRGRFVVMDLGSTNPTLVNGKKLERPWTLSNGDVIQIGDVELRYEEPGAGS